MRWPEISIHVPSWGTTIDRSETLITCSIFQSTFPRGERQMSYLSPSNSIKFQSTFPRGERRSSGTSGLDVINFNPRSLVGNDAYIKLKSVFTGISIHVPSWGTTANFHKYSLFFYAINIIFLLFIIPSLFSLVLFMLLF